MKCGIGLGEVVDKVKVNVDLYSAALIVRISPLRRPGVDHTVLPANTPHLPLPHSSPEDATTERTVIAPADEAYYYGLW